MTRTKKTDLIVDGPETLCVLDDPGYLFASDFNYRDPFFDPSFLEDDIEDDDDPFTDLPFDEYYPSKKEIEAMRAQEHAQFIEDYYLEQAEEEEEEQAERDEFRDFASGYSSDWQRSEESGWFYDDDF